MSDNIGNLRILLPQIRHTQDQTFEFFDSNDKEILKKVSISVRCYDILLALPTGFRFQRQSYYPYNLPFYEAMEELNSSVILAFSGEYKNAIQHLRFLFELAYLGIYLFKPITEEWVQKWLIGGEKTPSFNHVLKDIEGRRRFTALANITCKNLIESCHNLYHELSGYIHTRGFYTLQAGMRGTTIPCLNPETFRVWSDLLYQVIQLIALGVIGQFPQALQRLPLYDKFGFTQTPRGGFLEPFEVEGVEQIFESELLLKLRQFSNSHHEEVLPVKWDGFDKIPNLSLATLKSSFEEYVEILKLASTGEIVDDDKVWLTGFITPEDADESKQLGNANTPEEFILRATPVIRQINHVNELILAWAYTINLLKQKNMPIYKTRRTTD